MVRYNTRQEIIPEFMQKMLFNQRQYIIFSAIFAILLFVSIWFVPSALFGILSLILYVSFFGSIAGQHLLPKETKPWQLFWGSLTTVALCISILSGVYLLYEINKLVLSVILLLVPVTLSFLKIESETFFSLSQKDWGVYMRKNIQTFIANRQNTHQLFFNFFLPLIIIIGDILLLAILFTRRSTDTLISPWTLVGPNFFLLFVVTSILLFWYTQKSSSTYRLLVLIPHFTLLFTVSLIAFVYGYGFDPFIHQAAEQWILNHGAITPKQPYYIGQYMLVLVGHFTTHLSIHLLDKLLVPLAATILIPLSAYYSFTRLGFQNRLLPAILSLFLIPLSFFTLTTPNNLALLTALTSIFALWYQTKYHGLRLYVISGSLVALTTAIHAFIGIPLAILFAAFFLYQKIFMKQIQQKSVTSTILSIVYPFVLAASLPIVFYLNGLRTGEQVLLQNPFLHLNNLKTFFTIPHWYWITPAPLAWDILYWFKLSIPGILLIVFAIGLYFSYKKYRSTYPSFWLLTSIGLYLLAGFIVTTLRFPNVISYEQGVYAERITDLALLTLLPFFIISLRELFLFLSCKRYTQIPLTILFAVLITVSWYFTYPTRDPVSRFTGYSVRAADIAAVHSIQDRNDENFNYIVLTNQTVSAAALREFGFAKYHDTKEGEQYFYSIPTGGPLYQFFRQMVYEYPKKQWMLEAMDFAGVDRAYFIHTNYWYPAAELRDAAKTEADDWWAIGENPEQAWVFEYKI